jgi:hypothetical protein
MGAAAAVAILIRKEKEIVTAFRDHRATSPDHGISVDEAGIHDGFALRRLRDHAVIRDAGAGRYYLDEPVWAAHSRMRRRVALLALALIALLFVISGAVGGVIRLH